MTRQQQDPQSPKGPQNGGANQHHQELKAETWQFRLYVAGNAPHSRLAVDNLRILGNALLAGNYTLEIVDVMKEPLRTLEDCVFVTPTLVRLSPEPVCRIIGNLSDRKQVMLALGLEEASHG